MPPSRAVVLESGLGLESGSSPVFYGLGLVLDSPLVGLGLVLDSDTGLAKLGFWTRPGLYLFCL